MNSSFINFDGSGPFVCNDFYIDELLEVDAKFAQQVYSNDDRSSDKIQRRLDQNREAARRSRLRKKAHIQQLERSRLKLAELEEKLEDAKNQIQNPRPLLAYAIHSRDSNSRAFGFQAEYEIWKKQMAELTSVLNRHTEEEDEVRVLVERSMSSYNELFRLKATFAELDVFYILFGSWQTPAERIFLWIGGFRPSTVLEVFIPQLECPTDEQSFEANKLKDVCWLAEDALSQGLERLKQTMSESVFSGGSSGDGWMADAKKNVQVMINFVKQADHVRAEMLRQTFRILPARKMAWMLHMLSEFFQRIRSLSYFWTTPTGRPDPDSATA